jgi:hypothetical protein
MKKQSPSYGQNGQLVHQLVLVHFGPYSVCWPPFYTFLFEIKLHCGKIKPPKASDRKEFLQNYLLEILLSTTTSPSWWAGGCWLVHYVWPLKKSNNKYKVLWRKTEEQFLCLFCNVADFHVLHNHKILHQNNNFHTPRTASPPTIIEWPVYTINGCQNTVFK